MTPVRDLIFKVLANSEAANELGLDESVMNELFTATPNQLLALYCQESNNVVNMIIHVGETAGVITHDEIETALGVVSYKNKVMIRSS